MSEIRAEAQIRAAVRAQGQVSGTLGAASIILNDWVITLSEIEGGHRLTASRSGSAQSIDIMDGEAGRDGTPGDKGDKGDTGPQGPKGDPGEKGQDGTSFTVKGLYASLSALQSAQGTPAAGDAYAVGTAQDNEVYVYNATSGDWESLGALQGPKGEDGAPGENGAPGEAGLAATVAIGTVTTGEAGTQASVTNAGTANAAVLNFVIPQGAKGEKGDDGAPGTNGSDGAPGAKGVTFTPSVSEAGVLSWSNDGGLSNPASVSIKGEAGPGVTITSGTTDLQAGVSELPAGTVYIYYE